MLDQNQEAATTLRAMGLPLADGGAVIDAEALEEQYETPAHVPAHDQPNQVSAVAVRPDPVPAAYVTPTEEEPVDGAWLLNLTDAWVGQHCYQREAARHTMAMWILAQHFRHDGRMIWSKFGHLLFVAEHPGSGKSTAMQIAGYACAPWFFGLDSNPTAPGLCMTIAQEHATVCIDEAHRLIGPKGTRKADVVTIMCQSFEKVGSYLNGKGGKANRVPVYAPMMIAAKKDPFLTSAGEEIADVIDRSVLIMCEKPPSGTPIKPVTDETVAEGAMIAQRAAAWAAQQMADPERIAQAQALARQAAEATGLEYRDVDVWLGMLTVAALASPGHLQAACEAARELRLNRPVTRETQADPLQELAASLAGDGSFGWAAAPEPAAEPVPVAVPEPAASVPVPEQPRGLLADVLRVWPAGEAKVSSAELAELLGTTPRELAAALKPYGVSPLKLRIGDRTPWGYTKDLIADAVAMAAEPAAA